MASYIVFLRGQSALFVLHSDAFFAECRLFLCDGRGTSYGIGGSSLAVIFSLKGGATL